MESLNPFSARPAHPLNKQRGQATVEFALIAPLVFACAGLLVATTALCLQFLSLHDVARTAARSAVVSENPTKAARTSVHDPSIQVAVAENVARGTISVTVSRTGGLWWFNRLLGARSISQTVTMMREAPIVLR